MSVFNLNISDEADTLLNQRYMLMKKEQEKIARGDVLALLITHGLKASEGLPPSAKLREFPGSGPRVKSFPKKKHKVVLDRLTEFAAAKNFRERSYAARYCLYVALGLSADE